MLGMEDKLVSNVEIVPLEVNCEEVSRAVGHLCCSRRISSRRRRRRRSRRRRSRRMGRRGRKRRRSNI